jgi:hypothetical protein
MPGTFSKATRPRRPGSYVNFEALTPTAIPPATGSVVAMPITHDWGPFRVPTLVRSYPEFLALFGDSATPGKLAVRQCFQGEGLPGRSGAGGVIVYRTGAGAAAVIATKSLNNATVPALRLDAKYPGTRGNLFSVTIQQNAVDASSADIILLLTIGGTPTEVERYTRLKTDVAGFEAQIDAQSRYVTATTLAAGPLLTNVTNSAFASGTDGTAPFDQAAWTAIQAALEFERFGVFVPYDLTDPTIQTQLVNWAKGRNGSPIAGVASAGGQRFMLVLGGPASESVSAANTRSLSYNDPNVINASGFSVIDATDSTGVLTTSQLAPRIAGIVAARGENRSITFARMAGLTLTTPPTSLEVDSAFDSGTVLVSRDSNPTAPVRIEKGLTTWTSKTDALRSYTVFRNPKFVRTMQGIETEITAYAEGTGVIGELGVNDNTRLALVAEMGSRMRAREVANILQPGWSVTVDQDPPPSDQDEFIALRYDLKFLRSLEQVYSTIVVA